MTQEHPANGGGYLELLKECLTGALHQDTYVFAERPQLLVDDTSYEGLRRGDVTLAQRMQGEQRRLLIEEGRGGCPLVAETMVGKRRLENVEQCVEGVIARNVPGDLIEAGVWRGGVTILMRAILQQCGVKDRVVHVADSFQGLPQPDEENYPADAGDPHHTFEALRVSEADVRANFARYGLLDDQVRFVRGWFKDTLPALAGHRWALIRLDGDMYESTLTALNYLYPGLSVGGYAIVDDYGALPTARQAVDDFRAKHGIEDALQRIDWTGVFWRRSG